MIAAYLRTGLYKSGEDAGVIKALEAEYSHDFPITLEAVTYAHQQAKLKDLINRLGRTPTNGNPHAIATWDLWTLGAPSKDPKRSNLPRLVDLITKMYDMGIYLILANPLAPPINIHVWKYLAEYNKRIKSEATSLGIARAMAIGQRHGRPKAKIDDDKLIRLFSAKDSTGSRLHSIRGIAKELGVSRFTINGRLKELFKGKAS